MYSRRKFWKNVLSVLFIMFILTNGVVWVHQHAYATGVSPKAVTVYGQGGSFTSATTGTSTTTLNAPKGAGLDNSGNLYVADTSNNRVLYYASGSTTASRVYGQGGSFSTGTVNKGGISADSLNAPNAVALDSSGLYVADTNNNRVLYYAGTSTTATRVYGQGGSFSTGTANKGGISADSLTATTGLALDSSGLYITDYSNNRMLFYAGTSTTATRVYGQGGSFSTGTINKGGISADSLYTPTYIAFDSGDNLYVTDGQNNRVLYYSGTSTTATRVYGQGGIFSTGTVNKGGISADSLDWPSGLTLDSGDNLYIADTSNSRVLYYAGTSTTASRVYGQFGSFSTGTYINGGTSATSLVAFSVDIDSSGNLYMSDTGDNRVLVFQTSLSVTTQPPASPPATFSTAATLIDVGSGATFTDFTGTVSAAIKSGTGTSGAVLGGTTSVTASSGVATFSNLSINLGGAGYILTLSSPGVGSANTTTFTIIVVSPQAVTVYGQGGSFTSSSSNNGGISATSLNHPRSVVFDSSGGLYVAELNNNRVLYYPSGSTTATRVYGQFGSFSTNVSNNNGGGVSGSPNANNLNGPCGLALDSSGNLYVADDTNNRVLYYASGSTTATRVYGQAGSFSSNTANNGGVSADSLNNPNHIALDSSNNLYVADYFNSRVLYYAAGSTTATRVYGQAGSFSTSSSNKGGISANSLNNPNSVNPDSSGNLYVADHGNNRVLYYPSSSTTATSVYGQNSIFTSNLNNNTSGTANTISATSLSNPKGLDIDNGGNLYVADYNNNRVLYYAAGSTTATRVYGQGGSFSVGGTNTGGTSATSLNQPFGLTIDNGGNLYVADTTNNRVLLFQTSLSVTTQPPASPAAKATFSTAATLIDVGSGAIFSDFTGTVSVTIRTGTGASGAVLSGTTSVTASSGVATFSNLSINLSSAGYMLALSSPGVGSGTTNAFIIGSPTPTGYWKLDDGSGTTASDSSGSNNAGTIVGSGTSWTAAGKVNGALTFTGSAGTYVKMGAPTALQFGTGSFTIMSWFKTSSTAFQRMVDMGMDNYDTGFELSFDETGSCPNSTTGCVTAAIGGGSGTTSLSIGSTLHGLNDGNWHQAALVVDQTANTVQLYIDGTVQPVTVPATYTCTSGTGVTSVSISGCTSLNATSSNTIKEPFTIGALYNNGNGGNTHIGTDPFTGSLDEVRAYNSTLSSAQIQSQYTADTTPTLSGYWPFDEGSGTTTADLSGNNNTGTLTGASWTTGQVNGALSFNGTSNYVSTPSSVIDTSHSFSVGAWVKLTATIPTTVNQTFVSMDGTVESGFFLQYDQAGKFSFRRPASDAGGTNYYAYGSGTPVAGTWYYLVGVQDTTAATNKLSLYVNGTLQSTVSDTPNDPSMYKTTGNLVIGRALYGVNTNIDFVKGSIDEVRVYGNALTSAQIQNQYALDTMPSANGDWPLDENSGTTTADASSNHNNGTITGASWTSGKINSGLSFNGSTNYVTMGTPATLKFGTGSFTVMSWFKTTGTVFGRIVSMGMNAWSNGFDLGVNVTNACSAGCVGGELGGGSKGATISFGTTATTFNDGNWHQAAMVIDQNANTAQIYVDGVAQALSIQASTCGTVSGTSVNITACSSASATNSTDPFTVGAYRSSGGTTLIPFAGSIDEVRVYGSALSSSQVQNQYTNDITSLSEYASNASFSATIGTTATYTLPIALTYQTTPAPGWSLSITSTTLTSGANTLPTTASNITSVTGTCNTNWTCTSNTLLNTISGLPLALPAGTTAPTAAKFFSTAVGTGTGAYTVTPTFSVTVPATAKTGTYTSTITLTAATGP